MRTARWVAASFALFACSDNHDRAATPSPAASALPAGVVATAGALAIGEELVGSVATALDLAPRDALEREIHDALFANAALARAYDAQPTVRAALRGYLARALLAEVKREAGQRAIEDSEVAEATARHFVELDRPEAFRVIHAVVRVSDNATLARRGQAKALAERIATRVAPARDPEDFRARVDSIGERDGFEVVVETLKPVAADGRVVDVDHPSADPQHYVAAFARAASHLGEPGQKSAVVTTAFGFHVLMLVEKTPTHTVSLDERRQLLLEEILTDRARRMQGDLLQRLRAASPSYIERSADALLASVNVGEHAL